MQAYLDYEGIEGVDEWPKAESLCIEEGCPFPEILNEKVVYEVYRYQYSNPRSLTAKLTCMVSTEAQVYREHSEDDCFCDLAVVLLIRKVGVN